MTFTNEALEFYSSFATPRMHFDPSVTSLKHGEQFPASCFPQASPSQDDALGLKWHQSNLLKLLIYLERAKGFEPSTPTLARLRSNLQAKIVEITNVPMVAWWRAVGAML